MANARRLAAQALATARTALGWPMRSASWRYVQHLPAGMRRSACHTRSWNAVPLAPVMMATLLVDACI